MPPSSLKFAMKRETYSAARTISPKLHAYFARHSEEALARGGESVAPLPDAETIEALIDAAFWASLRREEGYPPKISLAFLAPDLTEAILEGRQPAQMTLASCLKSLHADWSQQREHWRF